MFMAGANLAFIISIGNILFLKLLSHALRYIEEINSLNLENNFTQGI